MKRTIAILMALCMSVLIFSGCAENQTGNQTASETTNQTANETANETFKGGKPNWKPVGKKYANFTDLGNYVIDVNEYNEVHQDLAIDYINNKYDGWQTSCTACATRNEKGEVIIGRNMDVNISQCPCYISHTTSTKYKTVGFTYSSLGKYKYEELLALGEIDEEYYNAIPFLASDVMNSEGLFIEANMREPEDYFDNSGTNPGKPRACTYMIPALVAQNCATVAEALELIQNDYDFYTMHNNSPVNGWNYAFVIGDATGEYGLIEIAHNQVSYLSHCHGQGNYYQTPKWNAVQTKATGYGRFAVLDENLYTISTEQDALELMKKAMWKNELLYTEYAYRDEKGLIHFVDDQGNEILDWRSDFTNDITVDENGKYVEKTGFEEGYNAYKNALATGDKESVEKYKSDFNKHSEYLSRSTSAWVNNDDNFEMVQKAVINSHKNSEIIDKLIEYYNGNEQPLRDDGSIWTTSFSFGVNCAKKHVILKLWEREDVIYEYQW